MRTSSLQTATGAVSSSLTSIAVRQSPFPPFRLESTVFPWKEPHRSLSAQSAKQGAPPRRSTLPVSFSVASARRHTLPIARSCKLQPAIRPPWESPSAVRAWRSSCGRTYRCKMPTGSPYRSHNRTSDSCELCAWCRTPSAITTRCRRPGSAEQLTTTYIQLRQKKSSHQLQDQKKGAAVERDED